jgi:uncharacterized YigZ family protein
MNSFRTIVEINDVLVKEKSSKFIGFGFYVNNEVQIKEKLEQIKEMHPKANHHCFAYRLGMDKYNFRANDDGEPSGTAGKPILGQIDSFGLTNCLLVVVRYFGGTKLGVSGLIETYKETAKQIVESTTVIELAIKELFTVRCSYFELDKLYKILTKTKARILEQTIENECKFVVEIEKENISEFIKATNNGGIFLV